MKLRSNLALLIMTAALCGLLVAERVRQSGDADVDLGASFQLKHAETVRIAGHDLAITFQTVEEDSRCPKGTDCVWAGRAIVRLTLSEAGKRRTVKLTFQPGRAEPAAARSGKYSLQISDLSPYPEVDRKIEPSQYLATLLVGVADSQEATL